MTFGVGTAHAAVRNFAVRGTIDFENFTVWFLSLLTKGHVLNRITGLVVFPEHWNFQLFKIVIFF